ncbi:MULTISPECIES: hypothetical protein [Chryseobacterium]|uniref:Uncharacterized protein n=1 Tax=Chryseobacterium camelliae TaxID=1265445 RepID=A0ABU0TN56_9FLAO|nr:MULTISPECIES: hypothetical protein [Chryseobacterium]MDT3407918.1 hypothetical protein [Pseudacidovorax intermedius]MDQ1098221.1 hypothetical protein [Chryseobacterium camelliae]MDQ1102152.1 hypothetical protein [Chryseobacterium sp. SORGH_AS_1048]MDR6085590.1 hypothetical protein [Chryseobacterium sp. SORGH_AS_0909]MDR6129952.1 hypothetical protein [Chryseobacterium sp. SORGH_AS_1175]
MKKIGILLLFSVIASAQKTEVIDLSKSVKDSKNSVGSFTVIDQRPDQKVGSVMYHEDPVQIMFEHTASQDIKDWFYKYNPGKGSNDMVFLLENLTVSEDRKEKYSVGKLELRASTFIKKDDGYHFVYRKDTVASVSSRNTPYMAQSLAKKITLIFTELLKTSYTRNPWNLSIQENDLPDYASLLRDKLDILKADSLKEGVYKDYYSFFTHSPEPGLVLQTNDKGIITKAVKGEEKTPIRNFYAFVYQGVAYKVIPVGYAEILRNDKGLFIEAKKEELFPASNTSYAQIGGATGGLVGGLIGAVIDVSSSKQRRKLPGSEVYIDPLTGNYILPEDFGKYR